MKDNIKTLEQEYALLKMEFDKLLKICNRIHPFDFLDEGDYEDFERMYDEYYE